MTSKTAHQPSKDGVFPSNKDYIDRSKSTSTSSTHASYKRLEFERARGYPDDPLKGKAVTTVSDSIETTLPVLVNSAGTMPASSRALPTSPPRTNRSSNIAPSPSAFSISSILHVLQSDDSIKRDIDAIAEIYGRSNLSLANSYTNHISPVGPGEEASFTAVNGDELETNDRLNLDTNATTHLGNLETVEELPSPASYEVGQSSNSFNGHGSMAAFPSGATTSSTVNTEAVDKPPLLATWQVHSIQARPTSGAARGVSKEIATPERSEVPMARKSNLPNDMADSHSLAIQRLQRIVGN